jgi:phosphatidate cytidylyltransferase
MSINPTRINTGRNLPVATAVGLLFGGLLVGSLYFDRWLFVALMSVAGIMALTELVKILTLHGVKISLLHVQISTPILLAVSYYSDLEAVAITFVIITIMGWIYRLRDGIENFVQDAAAISFVLFYVPLLLAFMVDLASADNGFQRVMAVALLTSANDTGGYFAGILAGRHPISKISPKKTWEGFAGSIVLAGLVGTFGSAALLDIPQWQGALVALAVVLTATAGDLIESAMKRDLGIKDMGTSVPGHGGMLDRIDSFLITAPIAWCAFVWILGV